MPTTYIRKGTSGRGQWQEEDLIQAVYAVEKKLMGVNEAAKAYSIPKTTLKRRLKTKIFSTGRLGPSSILGDENEKKIIHHINKLQAHGFTPSRDCVRSMAFHLAEKLKIQHSFNIDSQKAGYDWLKSFLARNQNLSIRKAEGVSVARALGMNKTIVMNYFDLLENILVENDLTGKPGNVFNMDETGLQLNNKPGQVIAIKGSKSVPAITSGEKGETISLLACCNGEGTFLPPFCIFKGKNKKEEYSDGMPPGTEIRMSQKSAYVNSDLFFDWLKNPFTPRKPSGKVLLIVDGHTSHTSCVEMLEFGENNDIILVSLPSHTTHYLQPLDRSFFKSLKSNFNSVCNNFMINHPSRKINRLQFGHIICSAWVKSATVENGVNGFKATGIIPLNHNAIPDYAYLIQENNSKDGQKAREVDLQVNNAHELDQRYENSPTNEESSQLHVDHNLTIPGISKQGLNREPIPGTSKQGLDGEPTPGTSKQGLDGQPTPSKLLEVISPVPALQKIKNVKKKAQNIAKVLNSPENITLQKEKKRNSEDIALQKKRKAEDIALQKKRKAEDIASQKEKKSNNKVCQGKKAKKIKKKNLHSSDSDEDDDEHINIVYNESDEDISGWDENECVGCGEDYKETTKNDDWIKCIICTRWLHEGCSKHEKYDFIAYL